MSVGPAGWPITARERAAPVPQDQCLAQCSGEQASAAAEVKAATGAATYGEGPHRPARPLHIGETKRLDAGGDGWTLGRRGRVTGSFFHMVDVAEESRP